MFLERIIAQLRETTFDIFKKLCEEQKPHCINTSNSHKWEGEFVKLSIIIPVNNLENYIATTLDSLLSIRFSFDYEIVVINYGSKDGSESIIRWYQRTHDQIVLYSIKNQGAKGKHIGC